MAPMYNLLECLYRERKQAGGAGYVNIHRANVQENASEKNKLDKALNQGVVGV